MIVALLNQKGVIGKTTLALHIAGQCARQRKLITLIDAGRQGSDLDWSPQRAHRRFDRLFSVIGVARDTLHREAPELARHTDHIVIDGPPRVAALLRLALLADLALIPAHPSPVDGRGTAKMLALIADVWVFRPALRARFVLNRSPARTIITRETTQSVAEDDPPALMARISQRIILVRTPRRQSCRTRDRRAGPRIRQAVAMTTRSRNGGFAARLRNAKNWIRNADPSSGKVAADLYTARLTVDITPALRGHRDRRLAARHHRRRHAARSARANFPTPMETAYESRAQHRARAAP